MPCTCRECLELAARGANVELLQCALQDPLPSNGPGAVSVPVIPSETNLVPSCPITRVQIVPFGLDEISMSEFEDPNTRPYLWELTDAGHPPWNH